MTVMLFWVLGIEGLKYHMMSMLGLGLETGLNLL